MLKETFISLRAIAVLTILTGIAYPLLVTGIAWGVFPAQAGGSLILHGKTVIGSDLIARNFSSAAWFHPRPSAAEFATIPSGAGNQGFSSRKLQSAIDARRQALGVEAPSDMLTTSASGLDPHLSPESARFQIPRVAAARGIPAERLENLVAAHIEPPQWGIFGCPRVNVLALNLALAEIHSPQSFPK